MSTKEITPEPGAAQSSASMSVASPPPLPPRDIEPGVSPWRTLAPRLAFPVNFRRRPRPGPESPRQWDYRSRHRPGGDGGHHRHRSSADSSQAEETAGREDSAASEWRFLRLPWINLARSSSHAGHRQHDLRPRRDHVHASEKCTGPRSVHWPEVVRLHLGQSRAQPLAGSLVLDKSDGTNQTFIVRAWGGPAEVSWLQAHRPRRRPYPTPSRLSHTSGGGCPNRRPWVTYLDPTVAWARGREVRGTPHAAAQNHGAGSMPVTVAQQWGAHSSSRSYAPTPDSRMANLSNDHDKPDHESGGHGHAA